MSDIEFVIARSSYDEAIQSFGVKELFVAQELDCFANEHGRSRQYSPARNDELKGLTVALRGSLRSHLRVMLSFQRGF